MALALREALWSGQHCATRLKGLVRRFPEEINTKCHRTKRYQPSLLQLQDFVLQRLIQLVQEWRDINRLLHNGFFDRVKPELPLLPCNNESNSGTVYFSQEAASKKCQRQFLS